MHWLSALMKRRFAQRLGTLIGFATVLLFVANPELFSFVLLANVIGVDVLVLLVGMQVQQNWLAMKVGLIQPVYGWLRRIGRSR